MRLIAEKPQLLELSKKIEDIGGVILESKIVDASMKDMFMYYTGGYIMSLN